MYDKLSISVLHRLQWMVEAEDAYAKLRPRSTDTEYDVKMLNEVKPRLLQIHYASLKCEHFFVEEHFRQLAQFATNTVPLDLVFDESLLITPSGWMEIENGFVPTGHAEHDRLHILIWFKPGDYEYNTDQKYQFKLITLTPPFSTDAKYDDNAMLWTDFGMKPGEMLAQLIERVPTADGYAQFVMCLLHLLGQRMTATREIAPRSNVASKAHAAGIMNLKPRVVTLRRMMPEDHVPTPRDHEHRDYNWQWVVRGHWRRQPYKSTGEIRSIFIDAFQKGPPDKPLKPFTHNIFVARR